MFSCNCLSSYWNECLMSHFELARSSIRDDFRRISLWCRRNSSSPPRRLSLSLYANTALSPHGNAIEHVSMYLPPESALSPYWPPAWEKSADNTFLRSVSSASFSVSASAPLHLRISHKTHCHSEACHCKNFRTGINHALIW